MKILGRNPHRRVPFLQPERSQRLANSARPVSPSPASAAMARFSQLGSVTAAQRVPEKTVIAPCPEVIPSRLPTMNCRNPKCEAPATRLKTAKAAIGTSCRTATAMVSRFANCRLSYPRRDPLIRSSALRLTTRPPVNPKA